MKPILITGAHRTGTTWAGKMLSLSSGITYVSEPLHLYHPRGVFSQPIEAWYSYICDDNGADFEKPFQNTIQFKYQLLIAIQNVRNWREAGKVARDYPTFLISRLLKRRALLKDPFAVLSVPWFISALKSQVVIMVRHPIPFVSSLKRLGWSFDFNHLLDQPLLMRDHFEPYRSEMVRYQQVEQDIVGQGILLWRMIYGIVHHYKTRGVDFQLVRHEDLSQRPLPIFEALYQQLEIPFSQKIEEKIIQSTQTSNPNEVAVYDEHAVRLNSLANLRNWKKRLTENEINRIVTDTRDVVKEYYELGEWKSW
ncbi:MAG: sulfotransferase [Anaerolineales bacterium]|nr:sulfotransferase [Anaerolineales bacterium]